MAWRRSVCQSAEAMLKSAHLKEHMKKSRHRVRQSSGEILSATKQSACAQRVAISSERCLTAVRAWCGGAWRWKRWKKSVALAAFGRTSAAPARGLVRRRWPPCFESAAVAVSRKMIYSADCANQKQLHAMLQDDNARVTRKWYVETNATWQGSTKKSSSFYFLENQVGSSSPPSPLSSLGRHRLPWPRTQRRVKRPIRARPRCAPSRSASSISPTGAW